eukprot:scaffold503521_cov40-Prasinocladus_malaysianus.AAC.1
MMISFPKALKLHRGQAAGCAVPDIAAQILAAVKASQHITSLIKQHETKIQVQAAAVKHSGKFVETFMKVCVVPSLLAVACSRAQASARCLMMPDMKPITLFSLGCEELVGHIRDGGNFMLHD